MFGIKGRDTFNKPQTGLERFFSWVRRRWIRIFPFALATFFLILCGLVTYMWYVYLHTKELTGVEKTAYINEKKSEATFRQEKFDLLKEKVIKRQELFKGEKKTHADVFYR